MSYSTQPTAHWPSAPGVRWLDVLGLKERQLVPSDVAEMLQEAARVIPLMSAELERADVEINPQEHAARWRRELEDVRAAMRHPTPGELRHPAELAKRGRLWRELFVEAARPLVRGGVPHLVALAAALYARQLERPRSRRRRRGTVGRQAQTHPVGAALCAWPDRTQREIAEQVGCHQSTVQRIKDQFMQAHELNVLSKQEVSHDRAEQVRVHRTPAGGDWVAGR